MNDLDLQKSSFTIRRKHRKINYQVKGSIGFKPLVQKNEHQLVIKVFLLNLRSSFFYTLANNISTDECFARRVLQIFVNYTNDFFAAESGQVIKDTPCSMMVVLDSRLLERFSEFVNHSKNETSRKERSLKLEIIGINLIDYFGTDRNGFSIVSRLLNKRIKYESFGSYFSTLGGACSSLGEELHFQAKNAETISLRQLELAEDFDDPNGICRGHLFLALSYIQLCKFKEAKDILNTQYALLNDPSNTAQINDHRLGVMCIAIIKKRKLHKYMYKKFIKR